MTDDSQHQASGQSPRRFEDVSGENIDNALNEIDELLESWDDRFTVENLALAKRYNDNELELGLIFSIGSGVVSQQYRAIFKRKFPVIGGKRDSREGKVCGDADKLFKSMNPRGPIDRGVRRCDRDQNSVFVDDVQLVQTPEGIIPSIVRLESFNQTNGAVGHATQTACNNRSEVRSVGTYREYVVPGGRLPVYHYKGVDQKIESGPEVMGGVAKIGAPSSGYALSYVDAIEYLMGLRILLTDYGIWITPMVGVDFGVEIIKVFFGPLDLNSDA